jgi:hypothetical protein
MKKTLQLLTLAGFLLIGSTANSQVLISLIFGEALNTPKIEFGLVGGINRSYITDIENSKGLNNFNIGFYFHINIKNNSYISTGCLVKSNVGAQEMDVYSMGNSDFDSIYQNGSLTKQINYFYVPIMFHQRFNDNRWYAEAGIQLGLRNKATDIFNTETLGGDLEFRLNVKDQYAHLDAGLIGGIGYKFKKSIKSVAIGANYYYGLVNVSKTDAYPTIKNSSFYFYCKIPIGANKKDKK